MRLVHPALSALPLALLLAACGHDDAPPPAATASGGMSRAEMVRELASTLQACSYDGRSEQLDPATLTGTAPADCRSMVEQVMGFTGLPQNFIVTEGPVANAAAVILADENRIPQRVIAFNRNFLGEVRTATGGNPWAPISIMAHEIGHHLSGHTITGTGSQPPIELEADKFSGFVLQRMGASLEDAKSAMQSLGTDHVTDTHPARADRLAAIRDGWTEACRQAGRPDCPSGSGTGAAPPQAPASPRNVSVRLPAPSAQTIPFKYGRFVVDETGKLDPELLEGLEGTLYDLAQTQGIELALLVVDDLNGVSAQDYAWAMLRQLRIGKLDLGNGGVFVVAPNQGTSAVAYAPGVAKQLEFGDPPKQFDGWTAQMWQRYCLDDDGCGISTRSLLNIVESQVRMLTSRGVTFQIRFNDIQEILDYTNARQAERRQGRAWDDKLDQTIGSLVRFSATVRNLEPEPEFLKVNEAIVKDGRWRAITVETEDGNEVTLYMQPQTEQLMPTGRLEAGKRYTFVGELTTPGQFHTNAGVQQGNAQLWLFSYDPLS
ncbi:TPM domain-containing protein [Luteimonas sp. BDR2-5]|uniref:TPM domain-containing protein n=1 Tax=Proluteimonas luteida TaxID=2878685 RepID=UPI001E5D5083|nr:TPM domain-containing protein [Luteimonas sp. BDR2-5]MCD9027256.1 TPM domain-containing protein [Luteimonas sp. BDR2-5]